MNKWHKIEPKCDNCLLYQSFLKEQSEIEETLKCALNITRMGIWEWNLQTQHVDLSEEIFNIIGRDPAEFDNTFEYVLNNYIHPQSQTMLQGAVESSLGTGVVPQLEYRVAHPELEWCWVRINGEIIYEDNGTPLKMIGTILDITNDVSVKHELKTALSFFESLMEAIPNPIFYKDDLGLYRFCNEAFLLYLGLSKEEIINKSVYDVAPKDLADIYFKADQDLMNSKGKQVYEASVKYADGSIHDVIFSKAAHLDDDNTPLGLVGVMQDITEKKRIEKQMNMLQKVKDTFITISQSIMTFKDEDDFFKKLLEDLSDIFKSTQQASVIKIDDRNQMTILTSIGFDKLEVSNFKLNLKDSFAWHDTNGKLDHAHVLNNISDYKTKGFVSIVTTENKEMIESAMIIPLIFENKLKYILSFDSTEKNVFTPADQAAGNYVLEQLPIFYQLFDLYRTTLHLSRFDSLTKLINRGYFETVFSDRINIADRLNDQIALVLFDLDGLKRVNDNFGHQAGDLYLQAFSDLLIEQFRRSDSFARIGGDEFAGIFSNTEFNVIQEKIERLRTVFQTMIHKSESGDFKGNFSYGIALYPKDAKSVSELMRIADQRMYLDKSNKKERTQF